MPEHPEPQARNGRLSIRLEAVEIEAIVKSFRESFGKGEIRLFGSRIDPTRRGGDIDLHVIPEGSTKDLGPKRVDFLVRLKHRIGERRIDLVVDRGTERPIDSVAKREGVLLWKS